MFCDAKQFKRQARKDRSFFALFSQSFPSEVPLLEEEQHQLTELLIFTSQEPTPFPVKWMEKDPTNCNRVWTRPLETELRRETTERGGQGGRFPMLTKENTNTPYLKQTLSTLTFIFPKKQSLQTNLLFLLSSSVGLPQALHGTWLWGSRESVPQLSRISIGKVDS